MPLVVALEAELAAADADVRRREAPAAAEGAAEGDGVEDDGEEVRRGNRGLRRAAMAAERELRASLAQRKKKGDGRVVGAGHSFGAFEAHTSGFGSRMLAKMGFQGEGAGMGKDGRGISGQSRRPSGASESDQEQNGNEDESSTTVHLNTVLYQHRLANPFASLGVLFLFLLRFILAPLPKLNIVVLRIPVPLFFSDPNQVGVEHASATPERLIIFHRVVD